MIYIYSKNEAYLFPYISRLIIMNSSPRGIHEPQSSFGWAKHYRQFYVNREQNTNLEGDRYFIYQNKTSF